MTLDAPVARQSPGVRLVCTCASPKQSDRLSRWHDSDNPPLWVSDCTGQRGQRGQRAQQQQAAAHALVHDPGAVLVPGLVPLGAYLVHAEKTVARSTLRCSELLLLLHAEQAAIGSRQPARIRHPSSARPAPRHHGTTAHSAHTTHHNAPRDHTTPPNPPSRSIPHPSIHRASTHTHIPSFAATPTRLRTTRHPPARQPASRRPDHQCATPCAGPGPRSALRRRRRRPAGLARLDRRHRLGDRRPRAPPADADAERRHARHARLARHARPGHASAQQAAARPHARHVRARTRPASHGLQW